MGEGWGLPLSEFSGSIPVGKHVNRTLAYLSLTNILLRVLPS